MNNITGEIAVKNSTSLTLTNDLVCNYAYTNYDIEFSNVSTCFDLLSKEAIEFVYQNQEMKAFLMESYKVFSRKNVIWKATLDKCNLDDSDKFLFKFFVGETRLKDNFNREYRVFSLEKDSVYDDILENLLKRSKYIYNNVVLDEEYL